MRYKNINVLFDLDGTLTNSKTGIINSVLYALDKLNIEEKQLHELDSFIGPPLRDSFMVRYNLSEIQANNAIKYYREYFSAKGLFENELYNGVPDLLESLMLQKYQLFVATSKPTVYTIEILKHFNLDKYFVGIQGSNLDNTHANKTEIISSLVSSFHLNPKDTIMVGDRMHDIIGAKNNSLTAIGVTYGFGSIEELKLHQPDFIVNNCNELAEILLRYTTIYG